MKRRILIIDDESINLDFFEVMLSRLGFEVSMASDGEAGLDEIRKNPPDLILLDNIMPRLTGWEVTRLLKKDEAYRDFRDIPVIMFSAMDAVKDKIEGFELGIEDYITKPFNFSEVLARIRAVLKHRDLRQQIIHKEKRLGVQESLKDSLVYFAGHIQDPVEKLLKQADELAVDDTGAVESFRKEVRQECETAMATLEALREKIDELNRQGEKIKEDELSLKDMEERFQDHFKALQQE